MSSDVQTPSPEDPRGIGGWLILPLLGFVLTMVWTLWNLVQALSTIDGLRSIFASSSGPLAELRIPVASSLIGGCLVIASAGYCLFLMYRKSESIKRFATAHYLILMVAGFIELWGDGVIQRALPGTPADPGALREALRGAVIAAVWIPYFHFSKRVRNTFTNAGMPASVAAG